MKEFTETIWAGFRILVIISVPWVVIGYFLQNYAGVPLVLAYAVFPIIYFGIMPNFDEVLKLLVVIGLVGGVWYGTGYILQTVLLLSSALAYSLLPAIIILSIVANYIICLIEYRKEEK